jgi:hypothetical protein
MLAKNLCPFNKDNCGPSNNITFQVWNLQEGFDIKLGAGETCSYMISAECGMPSFKPSTTVGFDIETIDYTDEDIGNTRRRRVLTSTDLRRELEETGNDYFLGMYLEED